MNSNEQIEKFIKDQLSVWPLATTNFRALKKLNTKKLNINGLDVVVQNNPARIKSTDAPEDEAAIKARRCFLCEGNRIEGQSAMKFEGRKGKKYDISLNPFPIFPKHLVIINEKHCPQSIWNNYVDITDLAHHFTGFTFFYNGPKSGASAPDHLHFQACPRGLMPLEKAADNLLDKISSGKGVPNGVETPNIPKEIENDIEYLTSVQEAQLFHYKHFANGIFFLKSRTSKSMAKLFYRLLDSIDIREGESEPRFNIISWYKAVSKGSKRPAGSTHGLAGFEYRAVVVCRNETRSHHYYSTDADHLRITVGCADIMGVFVAPDKEDSEKINHDLLACLVKEVTITDQEQKQLLWRLTRRQELIQVGILASAQIDFEIISDGAGRQRVSYQEGKIAYNGALYDELLFEAKTLSTQFAEPTFILHDVKIGIGFHWEKTVDQSFAGSLKFVIENGKVVAINIVGIEDYLLSVISSEMKSSASLEFLKAHAVISRSWVMSQILQRKTKSIVSTKIDYARLCNLPAVVTDIECGHTSGDEGDNEEYIKWFDHDDHKLFDVCADDHCQRYQGLTMAIGGKVRMAIDQTWGQTLKYEGKVCDCRFHKCCGGKTEVFSSCWGDHDYPYLISHPDIPDHTNEASATTSASGCFCKTSDEAILSQVLNDYDLETKDFYAWEVRFTRAEISELISKRSGIDFGTVRDLIPVETGPSGRIVKLKIVGSKRSLTIGKELIIRKWLSDSHLKSSAFTITWTQDDNLILEGRGWGHGVGLCQIGAAVMAYKGYTYRQILQHYYPNSELANE